MFSEGGAEFVTVPVCPAALKLPVKSINTVREAFKSFASRIVSSLRIMLLFLF
jgi:hypothetical protein